MTSRRPNVRPARPARSPSALLETLEGRRLLSGTPDPITNLTFDAGNAPVSEGSRADFHVTAQGTPLTRFSLGLYNAGGSNLVSTDNLFFDASGHFDSAVDAPESFRATLGQDFARYGTYGFEVRTRPVSDSGTTIPGGPGLTTTALSLDVLNVAPTLANASFDSFAPYGRADEGRISELTALDLGASGLTATINWGDGTTDTQTLFRVQSGQPAPGVGTNYDGNAYVLSSTGQGRAATHQYATNGTFAVSVTVNDGRDQAAVTGQITIDEVPIDPDYSPLTVTGWTPSDEGYGYVADEGSLGTVSGAWKSVRDGAGITASFDWGDGSEVDTQYIPAGDISGGLATYTFSHRFLDETPVVVEPDYSYGLPHDAMADAVDDAGATTRYGPQYAESFFVRNVAPTTTLTPAAASVEVGKSFDLAGLVSDPGVLDSQSVVIDWGDGTSQTVELAADGTAAKDLAAGHVYAVASETPYTISVTATDNDGGVGATATASVTVTLPAPPPPPAADPVTAVLDGDTLALTGTDADDTITLRDAGALGVGVTGNGVDLGVFPAKLIVIDVQGGDDDVDGSAVKVNLVVNGGAGDDSILGGGGSDLLSGGAGNDVLRGNAGLWDVLAGDAGNDLLTDTDGVFSALGGTGDDVIDLKFSKNWAALPGLSPTNANYRVSPGLIQGNAGSDVIRVNADYGNPAIYFAIAADDVVGGASSDTVVLLNNYRNGSAVLLDPLFNTNPGYTPGYDHIFGSHGGVGTGWDHTFDVFANAGAANDAVNARIQELLDGFRA